MDHELLDVVDEHGEHLGIKRRDAVHRDGDWHVAFHLWVVRADGVLLQRRSRAKASWPGYLDATAAGHLLAGEEVSDGLREVEEELGVAYAFSELRPVGVFRVDEARGRADGMINRELQHVFAVHDERPLESWTALDAHEVDELVLVDHSAFAALTASKAPEQAAIAWNGRESVPIVVRHEELTPAPYLAALAEVLKNVAADAVDVIRTTGR
jgi:isopentenyldiphosphate isomerase